MGLSTYAELQASVADEIARTSLTTQIPDFITRFEAKARRALRDWLRTTITATNVTADYALPATVSDVLSVSYNDGASGAHNYTLDLVSKDAYQGLMEAESVVGNPAGQVAYVDFDADAPLTTLRFWPPAGATGPIANLKIEVVKVLPSLSASQTTNALLREAPDLYLFGSCAEAARYLQHDERVTGWTQDRDAGFKELRILTERRLYGGSPRRRDLPRVFG